MLARHVSDLNGPSSGAFCTSCIRRLWYVVIRVLLDTSSRYEVVRITYSCMSMLFVITVFDIIVQSLVKLQIIKNARY